MGTTSTAAIFREMGFAQRTDALEEAVLYSLARTYSLLARELVRVYVRFGLTAASFNLLMLLKHGADPDACTQQAIGTRLVVSPSDMTGLIDRLERKGLVRRTPGKDRRSKLLRITKKGAALLDEVWPHHMEAVEHLAGVLSLGEARTLVAALAKLRRAVGR